MYSSIADDIKNSVTMTEVLDVYGIEHSKGKACCPFHNEKTPSFVINRNNKAWKCYGCGEGGTIVDFVMLMDGLSFGQALIKINSLFNLNLLKAKKLTYNERNKRRIQLEVERAKKAEEERIRQEYADLFFVSLGKYEEAKKTLKTENPTSFDDMSEDFIKALEAISFLRFAVDFYDIKRGGFN